MPFTDPRRVIATSERNDQELFGTIKTLGLIGAVSITGLRLGEYFDKHRSAIEADIARARYETQKNALIFSNPMVVQSLSTAGAVDEEAVSTSAFHYDPTEEANIYRAKKPLPPDLLIYPESQIEDALSNLERDMTMVHKGQPVLTAAQASQIMGHHGEFQVKKLQKEYPKLLAVLNEVDGIKIKGVDIKGLNYNIHVTDGVTHEIIKLPMFKSGVVEFNHSLYVPSGNLDVARDLSIASSFADNFTDRLSELSSNRYFGQTNKPRELKALVNNLLHTGLTERVDGNTIKPLLSQKFHVTLKDRFGTKPSPAASEGQALINRLIEKSPIYVRTGAGEVLLNEIYKASVPYASVTSVSEASSMKGTVASRMPIGVGPSTTRAKASQTRWNVMTGFYMGKDRYHYKEIAAKLGPLSRDASIHLAEFQEQTIPGGMFNVVGMSDKIPMRSWAGGGNVFLLNYMLDPKGDISTVKRNLSELDGTRRRDHKIPLARTTQLDVGIDKNVMEMIATLNDAKRQGKKIILKKGTWLGTKGAESSIRLDEDEHVYSFSHDDAHLFIHSESVKRAGVGTKTDQLKTVTQKVRYAGNVAEEFGNLNPLSGFMGKLISRVRGSQLAPEFLVNVDQLAKFQGGGIGMGIIQKTMSDLVNLTKIRIRKMGHDAQNMIDHPEMKKLEKSLREVLRTFLGADIDNIIDEVGIAPTSHEPFIILKGKEQMPDKIAAATMADPAFAMLIDIENAYNKSRVGDWRQMEQYAKLVEPIFAKHGLPQYRMIETVDIGNIERDAVAMVAKYDQSFPTFIRTIISKGQKGSNPEMVSAVIRTTMAAHQQNMYEHGKFSSLVRGKGGYQGGVKSSLEHYEVARNSGWQHMARYIEMLSEYDFGYVQDKLRTAEANFLGPKANINKAPNSFIKTSGISVIKQSVLDKLDINTRLAEYNLHGEAITRLGLYKLHANNMSGLQGALNDPEVKELINAGFFQESDLRGTAHITKGRHSVDITEKALVDDLMDLWNKAKPGEAVYLELPETIIHEGKEINYIPVDRFDISDMYELEASRLSNGTRTPLDQVMRQKFTTGNEFHTNRMYLLKEMARIKQELVQAKVSGRDSSHLKEEMSMAITRYYSRLNEVTKGSDSPLVQGMFKTRYPFSMRGLATNLAVGDRAYTSTINKVSRFVDGLPSDSVYIHEDDFAKLMSGGQVESVAHAKSVVNSMEALRKTVDLVKGIPAKTFTTEDFDSLYDTVVQLSRQIGKMPQGGDLALGVDTAASMKMLGHKASRAKSLHKVLTGKDDVDHFNILISKIKKSVSASEELGKMIPDDLKRTEALHRHTLNMIQGIKEGTLEVGGYLERAPVLSAMSGSFVKVGLFGTSQFAQNTINKHIADQLNSLHNTLGRGGIYSAKELYSTVMGDVDGDSMSFTTLTLDSIEQQSRNIEGLSILKTARILGADGDDIRMAMMHDLSKEQLVNRIMGRLAETSVDAEGKLTLQRPASLSSITIMDAYAKQIAEGRVDTEAVSKYIGNAITRMYPGDDLQKIAGPHTTIAAVRNQIEKKVLEETRRFLGSTVTLEHLQVITAGRETANETIRKSVVQPSHPIEDGIGLIKEQPEHFAEAAGLAKNPDQMIIRDALRKIDLQHFEAYQEQCIRLEAPRFQLIKEQTPTGFNARGAMYALNYRYLTDNKDKAFSSWVADKLITQNVISSKHGTPQVIVDLKGTLRKLTSLHGEVLEKELDKLSKYNFLLTRTHAEKQEMKALGFDVDDCDTDMYEDYLRKRVGVLEELDTIQTSTREDLILKKAGVNQSIYNVKKLYRQEIDAKIQGSVNLKGYDLPEWHYSSMITSDELKKAKDAVANSRKIRDNFAMMHVKGWDSSIEANKNRWSTLIGAGRMFSYENNGLSVFDATTEQLFRTLKGKDGKDGGMLEMFRTLMNKETMIANTADNTIKYKASNAIEHMILRMGSMITNQAEGKRVLIGGNTAQERQMRLRYLANREIRQVQRSYAERIVEQSTVFRPGSMFNLLERKISTTTASAITDQAAKKIGRSKGANLLLGLFTGTIIGQSINQIANGYAIPDLGGTANGLGGEYYDRRRPYLGREMEVMMGKSPLRIAPNQIYDNVANRELASMGPAEAALGVQTNVRTLEPYLKGSIVR